MRKEELISGVLLLICGGILIALAPDALAMLIVGLMDLLMGFGFFASILPSAKFSRGFRTGIDNIAHIKSIPNESTWVAVGQTESLFRDDVLDDMFSEYKEKVFKQEKEPDAIICDIDEVINEDSIELVTWQRVVSQIPNTLTGLGILGTFIGLIIGISNIRFSTMQVAVGSVQSMLVGIGEAFYTSISGVILSILYTLIYRTIWNMMLRNMNAFYREFHVYVLPSAEEQERTRKNRFYREVLERIGTVK